MLDLGNPRAWDSKSIYLCLEFEHLDYFPAKGIAMQSVSSGSQSLSSVSRATNHENFLCSSILSKNERALGRRYRMLPLHSLPLAVLTSKARMEGFCTGRKLMKVGEFPEVSYKKSACKSICRAQVIESVLTDREKMPNLSSEQKVYDVILKQAALVDKPTKGRSLAPDLGVDSISVTSKNLLDEAYERCGEVCAEYAKTFYLGTLLMTPERRKAIWAIYVWCRRTDELVDGPNASQMTPSTLDRWEQRLESVFEGEPYDMMDAALTDTVLKFPVDIQPFRDMINGMRMDLVKSRYFNFDELYLYCYYVAGTVGLMSVPVMGINPGSRASTESVYNSALALGIANQLTNILRDVGEDASRGRIYLPQDELQRFGLSDDDIYAGIVTDKWRAFMKDQIKRARIFFKEAGRGVLELDKDSRWPVWASLLLYEQILDSIEANDYNNFTTRAYVGKWKKLVTLSAAYVNTVVPPSIPRLAVTV